MPVDALVTEVRATQKGLALDGDAAGTLSPDVFFKFFGYAINDTGSQRAPGARGEFGSQAIRPRSSYHLQVIML